MNLKFRYMLDRVWPTSTGNLGHWSLKDGISHVLLHLVAGRVKCACVTPLGEDPGSFSCFSLDFDLMYLSPYWFCLVSFHCQSTAIWVWLYDKFSETSCKSLNLGVNRKIRHVTQAASKSFKPSVILLFSVVYQPTLWKLTIVYTYKVGMCLVTQSCPTLCNPMVCSLSGCSVYGVLQVRILEWIAMPSSRGSAQLKDQTQVSHIARGFFTSWATREAQRGV